MDSLKNNTAVSAMSVADFQIAGFGETSVDFYDIQGSFPKPNRTHQVIDGYIGKSSLAVQCEVVSIVHGTMKDGSDVFPASLIIYKFIFAPFEDRRFTHAKIKLDFVGSGDNFEVSGIAPYFASKASPSSKTIEVDNTGNISLNVPVATSAGFGYTFKKSETSTKTSYIVINGLTKSTNNVSPDGAVWTMDENPQTKNGIPNILQTAVLVRRDPKDTTAGKFQAKLKIHCEVHATIEDWLKIHGTPGSRSDEDKKTYAEAKANDNTMTLYYDASQESFNPWNIDAKQLDTVNLADYQGLIIVPDWAQGKDSHMPAPTATEPSAAAKPPAASPDVSTAPAA